MRIGHAASVAAIAAMIAFAPPAHAWDYLGVGLAYSEVRGDFDDSGLLTGVDAIYDIPRVDPGIGPRFVMGFGSGSSFELSYTRTTHRSPGVLRPDGYPTTYQIIGLGVVGRTGIGRKLTGGAGEVTIRVGIDLSWFRMNGSGTDLLRRSFDVEYAGGGFLIGPGFEFSIAPRLRAHAEAHYRFAGFNEATSRGQKSIEIEKRVSASGPAASAGITWRPRAPRNRGR